MEKQLRNFVDKIKPTFSKGGKLGFLHSTFDAFETFLFVPNTVTRRGSHIRDANDLKRTMMVVIIALLPALLFGLAVGTAFPSTQGCDTYPAALLRAAAGAAIPGILLTIFTIAGRLAARREVLGWGDVKFAAAAGALLGAAGALFCVATGALTGTVYGIALALTRKRSMKHLAIPFGPFLAGGALVWIFFGEKILRWYLSLLRLAQ